MKTARRRIERARPKPLARRRSAQGKPKPQGRPGARVEKALEALNEGYYDWNIKDGAAHYSERVLTVLGLTRRQLRNAADWHGRIHPEDRAAYDAALVAHFKGRTARFECDFRFQAGDGSWRWARQHGIAVRGARGRAVRMVGSTGDITEWKRTEQALRESQQRYELATSAAVEGIYEWDLATNSLTQSERAKQFFGMPEGPLTPAAWNERVHPEDFPRYRQAIIDCFKGTTARLELEYRLRHPSGGWFWILDHGVAVRDASGRAIKLIGALSDIDQRKRAELELRRARDEATAALERQTATAEILNVIARSPADVQPVLDAVAASAARLCGATDALILTVEEGMLRRRAHFGAIVSASELRPVTPHTPSGRAVLERRTIHVEDILEEIERGDYPESRELQRKTGFRTLLSVPLTREDRVIGVITIRRLEVRAFTEKQIALVSMFADQAVIAIENVRLFNEIQESLEQQKASGEVLGAISGSIADTAPVFDKILESCERLFAGRIVGLNLVGEDGLLRIGAYHGAGRGEFERIFPMPVSADSGSGLAIAERRVVHYPDAAHDSVPERTRQGCRAIGIRSVIFAPLLWKGKGLGAIFVGRGHVSSFSEKEIALLRTFADQAAIAIENVRLFNETKESLERQTAISEILRVISSSPGDVQPVLQAVAERAARICEARVVDIILAEGNVMRVGATVGDLGRPTGEAVPLDRSTVMGRSIVDRQAVHVADLHSAGDEFALGRQLALKYGHRTILAVPLVREDRALGTILVRRAEVRPIEEKHVALLQTFADQAAIAIENARLFNETKEALERQTATAEILRVMASSPSDVQPVFDAIAHGATRLCDASFCVVFRYDGRTISVAADDGRSPGTLDVIRAAYPRAPGAGSVSGRVILERRVISVEDAQSLDDPAQAERARAIGYRSILGVPMMRGDRAIGAINVARLEARPFTETQAQLLKTFADQAVIAIENVRLFNETREALERQTATAEILKVIASSPSDVQPVFDAIVNSAARLFGRRATLRLVEPGGARRRARSEASSSTTGELLPINDDSLVGRVVLHAVPMQVVDTRGPDAPPYAQANAHKWDFRSNAAAPLIRDGAVIGLISVASPEPGALSDKQMALLATFADQAVIAIENARLFNETKEALERQTATAEILKVISSSPTDAQPVFDAIVESAARLFDRTARIRLVEGNELRLRASRGPAGGTARDALPIAHDSIAGQIVLEKVTIQIADTEAPGVPAGNVGRGYRAIAAAPLVRDGTVLGAIAVTSLGPGALSEKQMALLRTFADQAVIAIENVRLFNETKEALQRQTATAEILRVISRSPTDTQPVFDAIVDSCARLFDGLDVGLQIVQGDVFDRVAASDRVRSRENAAMFPMPLDRESIAGRCMVDGKPLHIEDLAAVDWMREGPRSYLARRGFRSALCAPMSREGKAIGAIVVFRGVTGRFNDEQVALLQTFADQAVIAIENVRLFKELQSRTEALSKSVQQLTALGQVGQAISSTLDLEKVLSTIVTHALRLTGLDGGSVYAYDEASEEFRLQATENMDEDVIAAIRRTPIRKGDGTVGATAVTLEPMQVPDILDESYRSSRRELLLGAGYRAVLTVPLLREDRILGALSVTRKAPGAFPTEVVELLKTFATQSAMAMQNARLFREIAEKSRQLEEASKHKSQFLASMSHELRTPLNAILGFNEMLLGEVYGEVPTDMKEPLADIQSSGKHLLRLINNVLDLAKIEAGRMELALSDYSVHDTVESVRSTLRPLAEAKGLELVVEVPPDLPLAHGDSGRITQCLMNLAGNSLKFTKQGSVGISVALDNGTLTWKVEDTGIGIPADKIGTLFTEFKQTDATIASEYGGTGLGLSISKKFIEMHGGRIWAESEVGRGSRFIFEVPLRAAEKGAE